MAIIEILDNCNLNCPTCIAGSFPGAGNEKNLSTIEFMLDTIVASETRPDIVMISGVSTAPLFVDTAIYSDGGTFSGVELIAATPAPTPPTGSRLEESFTYDNLGNIKTKVDTAGHTTSYDYDAASRLTKITDALSHETQFTYNARSQMTKVKDALNQEYNFTYDALGRTLTQNRNSQTTTFTYNAVGSAATKTDYNGNVATYTYDDLNRLTAIAYTGASGENASYTYDDLSRLLTAVNAAGTVTFTYNNRGRLASETDVFGHVLGYTYDYAGNRTALTLDSNAQTSYAYDNANRLTTLTDESSNDFTFAYDNANKLTSRVAPNGVTSAYTYDGMSRLKRLKHYNGSGTLYDDQFAYNSANQISQIAGLSQTRNFTYDNINRLTAVAVGGSTVESYTYDAVGNRTASSLSSSYTTGAFNRLTATDTASYTYNNNGSMTGKTVGSITWTYAWDRGNRMVSAGDGTNSVSYLYDALGRRIKRTQASDVQKYTHDGSDVALDDVNSTLTKYQNGQGIDNKLEFRSGSTSKYFLNDHLGSTAVIANSSGASVDSNTYDSFGDATNGSFTSRYRFTGRELDGLSGLQFSRARNYDQNLGRFISEDPIGFRGGDVNLFGYVRNLPIMDRDPYGKQRADRDRPGDFYPGMREPYKPGKADLVNDIACPLDGYNPWLTVDFGGALQALHLGGSGSLVFGVNLFTFEVTGQGKAMSGIPFSTGFMATGGSQIGLSLGPVASSPDPTPALEVFGDVTAFGGGSGSIGYDGSFGGGIGIGPTIGSGAAGGFRYGMMYPLFSVNRPTCSCKK